MNKRAYSGMAIFLHWLTALLLIGSFSLGLYMVGLKFSPQKLTLYSYHKWIGVSVFCLALVRLLWRLGHRPPPLPSWMPAWQAAASSASHTLLYLLLLATPISGWFFSSAAGVPTVPFGVAMLQLPDMVDKNGDLAVTLKFVHMAINYALGALICLHIAAALKHLLINQDGIMSRMLPGHKK